MSFSTLGLYNIRRQLQLILIPEHPAVSPLNCVKPMYKTWWKKLSLGKAFQPHYKRYHLF
jgi:hypothetical protein